MEEGNIGEEEPIISEREIFSLSGPVHLTSVDWNNFHHRSSVAASLVKGVYVLEYDRQQGRQGPQAHAPPWWEFFHFQLNHVLIDDVDGSNFGAIYEFKNFAYTSAQNAPRYVIALRGTIKTRRSIIRDLKLDFLCLRNKIHESSRFQLAMHALQNMVALAGAANVWLAGHSLGSAIALLGGKNMAKMGILIESYLFNPPFLSSLSSPVERIKNQNLKRRISMVKAGLAVALKGHQPRPQQEDSFVALPPWLPYLFVNPADPICSEYIGHFGEKNKVEGIGTGKSVQISEALHLIPSAYLTVNLSESPSFKQAHGIDQWWNPIYRFQRELHNHKCS